MNKPESYLLKNSLFKGCVPNPTVIKSMNEFADDFAKSFFEWYDRTALNPRYVLLNFDEVVAEFRKEKGL